MLGESANWLATNGLALYGAIVGTFALGLSGYKVFLDNEARKVNLRVSVKQSENFQINLELLQNSKSEPDPEKPWIPVDTPSCNYVVEVANIGSVTAFLRRVCIVDQVGEIHEALVPTSGGGLIVEPTSQTKPMELQPKAYKSYLVNIAREKIFIASYGLVEDSTGTKWKSKRLK